jgi:hypothetical protein
MKTQNETNQGSPWPACVDCHVDEPDRAAKIAGEGPVQATLVPASTTASERAPEQLQRCTAGQVMALKAQMHAWRCPHNGCQHELRFKLDQVESIPFFIVRHLLRMHGLRPQAIIGMEPALSEEVHEYCRVMKEPE